MAIRASVNKSTPAHFAMKHGFHQELGYCFFEKRFATARTFLTKPCLSNL